MRRPEKAFCTMSSYSMNTDHVSGVRKVTLPVMRRPAEPSASARASSASQKSTTAVPCSRLHGTAVVDFWLAEEARALADGSAGLRITGNVTFLTPETWSVFMEYEDMVQKAFSGRRIVTLCTYPADGCGAANVLDVVHRHSCTLEHPDEGWQILTGLSA